MPDPQIVAIGGGVLVPDTGNVALERYILDACGATKPRVVFVPTASGDDVTYVARFYESYARFGVGLDVLRFFRRTPDDLRAYLFAFDVVHVGGGNTRSMLAVWRHWGFDAVLREAWERGILLCGSSAGSICWFDRLVASGELAAGIACDDGAGVHFRGRTLARAISARPGAGAYRVARGESGSVETPLEVEKLRE